MFGAARKRELPGKLRKLTRGLLKGILLMDIKTEFETNMMERGSIQTFVDRKRDLLLYYSTPAGNNDEGKQMLFLMTDPAGAVYLPAFTSEEACRDFFKAIGRSDFVGLKNTLENLLDTLDTNEMLKELGILIDGKVPVPADVRCTKN